MKRKMIAVFLILCVATIMLFVIFNFVVHNKRYSNYVRKYSKEFNLEPALVYAVIKTESNFEKSAVSGSGALGLMQIIPSTAKWIASKFEEEFVAERMFEPETNIKYGCYYLRYLFDKFESIDIVICAYNAGETAVVKWLDEEGKLDRDKIAYEETKNYLYKVEGYYRVYKSSDISIW